MPDCVSGGTLRSFRHCIGPVKLVRASLDVQKDVESIFHHCGGSFYAFPSTKRGMYELKRASIATKTALKVFPCTENPVKELHKTSTMVETASWITQDIQTSLSFVAGMLKF